MTCRHKGVLLLLILSLVFSSLVYAATPEPPEKPASYVVDLAQIINPDTEAALNASLRELEQKTTAQVVVLTIESLEGDTIEDFSLRTAEKWKLGQKGKDNGVLLTVALKDRKYRFEVGYGLESVLPDSMVGSIGRQYMAPYFRKGQYSEGIYNATLAAKKAIADFYGVSLRGTPEPQRPGSKTPSRVNLFILLVAVLIGIGSFINVLMNRIRRTGTHRDGWWGGYYPPSSGGFGSGGFGGGGFGGGFGGGGGGGFGGGGASGGW